MKKLLAIAAGLAMSTTAMAAGDGSVPPEREARLRVIAYSATLAKFVSTNNAAFAAALSPSARRRWQKEEPTLRVKDVQLLLPDFFRVVYAYNGGVAGDAFCFGLYNPFYDHMLLCKAKGLAKTEVVDFKWVSGAALRNDAAVPEHPPATGVDPADEYFHVLLGTMGGVLSAFNRAFVGPDPAAAFSAAPALDDAGTRRLLGIAALRTAQAVKMTGDKSAFGLATLAAMVFGDAGLPDRSFLGKDAATQATLKTLSDLPKDVRKAFRAVGYFEASGEKCVLFYNKSMPTFLALARTRDGNTISLGMFDVRIADGWEKKVNN